MLKELYEGKDLGRGGRASAETGEKGDTHHSR